MKQSQTYFSKLFNQNNIDIVCHNIVGKRFMIFENNNGEPNIIACMINKINHKTLCPTKSQCWNNMANVHFFDRHAYFF